MMDLNKIRVHDTMYIRKDIPVLSEIIKNGREIALYCEPSYHDGINRYIRTHYDEICQQLDAKGITFVYIPQFLEHLDEYIQYNFPDSSGIDTKSFTADNLYSEIAGNLTEIPSTGRPLLIAMQRKVKVVHTPKTDVVTEKYFSCFDLDYADDHQFGLALRHYISTLEGRFSIRFHKSNDLPLVREEDILYGHDADRASNDILFSEIAERVEMLSARGVNKALIRQFLFPQEPKLSKLVITEDFRLLLPDYGNREIRMHKLSKALYFLYLRHKEGLRFKELCDHKDELFDLYRTVSPREDMAAMERSVEDIVDSTKNSVNVTCSRIKNAFVSEIDDSLAKQYYIAGRAGEPKFIALDRSLVEDRSGMIM